MRTYLSHIGLTWLLWIGIATAVSAQSDSDLVSRISKQVQLMRESKTADDIYTVRTRLENMAETAPKDLATIKSFRDAYLVMADKLAAYDHYKSGCNAYFKYLELEESYHNNYMAALRDSIGSDKNPAPAPKVIEPEPIKEELVVPTDTIVNDSTIIANQDQPVSNGTGSGSANTVWIVLLTTLIIGFGIMTFSQRKRLSKLMVALVGDQSEVKRLFRISATVSMISGVIRYAREFSAHCADVLSDMVESMKGDDKSGKTDEKSFSPAQDAISVFRKISSDGRSTTGEGGGVH